MTLVILVNLVIWVNTANPVTGDFDESPNIDKSGDSGKYYNF